MPPRAIIIHRWGARTDSDWYPWLSRELIDHGFEARVPPLPEPDAPKVTGWLGQITDEVDAARGDVVLVGHGTGAQAILRYLQGLPDGARVSAAVLVAPWTHVSGDALRVRDRDLLAPWLAADLQAEAVRRHVGHVTALFSDDDTLVGEGEEEAFRESYADRVIRLQGRGHFTGGDGIIELPEVRDTVLQLVRKAQA